ncbi:MAG TPA: hypothetical protein VF071_01695 [Candidatus Limnocylindria bacterium]
MPATSIPQEGMSLMVSWHRLMGAAFALLLAASLGSAPAAAGVRLEGFGIPAYARIAGPAVDGGIEEVYHNDQWAVIPFYRPPACVPADFNLLLFFDIPAVFACGPQSVSDATIWRHGPAQDLAPTHVQVTGLGAVPVWFVTWPELEGAMSDGSLTITELAGLPSLQTGSAALYAETIHTTQAAQVPFIATVAAGELSDGRSFRVQATRSGGAGGLTHVGISFE